jgi:hypothetical protein
VVSARTAADARQVEGSLQLLACVISVGPVYDASGLPIYFTPGSGTGTSPTVPASATQAPLTWTINGATYSNSYFPGAIGPVYDSQGVPTYYLPGGGGAAAVAANGNLPAGAYGGWISGTNGLPFTGGGVASTVAAGAGLTGGGIAGAGINRPGMITFHAATGADFTVPGAGGSDSILAAGWVSPGEHVQVTPSGGNDNGRPLPQVANSQPIQIGPVNVIANDRRSFLNSEAQMADMLRRAVYAEGLK